MDEFELIGIVCFIVSIIIIVRGLAVVIGDIIDMASGPEPRIITTEATVVDVKEDVVCFEVENRGISKLILNELQQSEVPLTPAEICAKVPLLRLKKVGDQEVLIPDGTISTFRLCKLMRPLCDSGVVVRTCEKRVVKYAIGDINKFDPRRRFDVTYSYPYIDNKEDRKGLFFHVLEAPYNVKVGMKFEVKEMSRSKQKPSKTIEGNNTKSLFLNQYFIDSKISLDEVQMVLQVLKKAQELQGKLTIFEIQDRIVKSMSYEEISSIINALCESGEIVRIVAYGDESALYPSVYYKLRETSI